MNETLDKRQLPKIDINTYRELFNFPIESYYAKLGLDMSKKSFEELGKEFIKRYIERMYEPQLYKGATSIMQNLSELGITHSILSASEHGILSKLVEYYKIEKLCIKVSGTDNYYARGKIDMARLLVKEIKIKASEILVVGDSIHDLDVSKSIQSNCVLLSHGHFTRKRLEAVGSLVCDNFNELENYIIG